jgi:hypothetical protein
MKDDNDPIIGVVLFIISVVVCIGLVISRREENKKALEVKKETETQVCQRVFGKDYVYQIPKTIHETPYCLGNDGIRKYLKRDENGNINQ